MIDFVRTEFISPANPKGTHSSESLVLSPELKYKRVFLYQETSLSNPAYNFVIDAVLQFLDSKGKAVGELPCQFGQDGGTAITETPVTCFPNPTSGGDGSIGVVFSNRWSGGAQSALLTPQKLIIDAASVIYRVKAIRSATAGAVTQIRAYLACLQMGGAF
jgi:hypothetical protein